MQRESDRWVSIGLSVLLHGALLAALVYGWLLYRRPPRPAPTLAIEATVVDARAVRGVPRPAPQPTPPPAPPAPPSESEGPPQPTAAELAQREEQRHQAEAAAAAEQRAAQAKADEERKAREAEAQQRAAEARQQKADAQAAEADLKRSLAAEEHTDSARSGPALANWQSQIAAKITRAFASRSWLAISSAVFTGLTGDATQPADTIPWNTTGYQTEFGLAIATTSPCASRSSIC